MWLLFVGIVTVACDQSGGVPAKGKMTFGSLETAPLRAFFEEKTGVELPGELLNQASIYKYLNDSGEVIGFTDVVVRINPQKAVEILEATRISFKTRHAEQGGLEFEYDNFAAVTFAGMTIPENVPVLYRDDGNLDGEQIHLQVDPATGVIRLAYSVGVERDDLAKKAAFTNADHFSSMR